MGRGCGERMLGEKILVVERARGVLKKFVERRYDRTASFFLVRRYLTLGNFVLLALVASAAAAIVSVEGYPRV